MAFVILRPGASADEAALLAHLDGKLERFKLPRFVEIVSALPRNERDKLARGPLKALAAEAARRRGRGDA
jgi:fatty-acyl-CoA synthase